MKILIVDDDLTNRVLLNKMLAGYGECSSEEDGKKALGSFVKSLYDGSHFDLILLDIMMPNIDGQELLKIIRAVEDKWGVKPGDEVKIIMVTALDSPKDATEAFFKGFATDYVVKPVDFKVMKEKIDSLFPGKAI
ncbi:MAG: response regulator [Desulfovibrionaceae bacterium]|nr:response regulator [Desulfovibrionaceae bacterium]MBF0512872.1 response regulator [Desulfovibrionaceae bacterium]